MSRLPFPHPAVELWSRLAEEQAVKIRNEIATQALELRAYDERRGRLLGMIAARDLMNEVIAKLAAPAQPADEPAPQPEGLY